MTGCWKITVLRSPFLTTMSLLIIASNSSAIERLTPLKLAQTKSKTSSGLFFSIGLKIYSFLRQFQHVPD